MSLFIRYCLPSLLFSLSFSSVAQGKCDVELGHGLIITDSVIRIVDTGQTRVQIINDNQLKMYKKIHQYQ